MIVVHGFGGKRLWMWPLSARLRSSGFRVRNFGYLSVLGSVEKHARRLTGFLAQFSDERRVHLVAHSMGTALVRAALASGEISNPGRIIFLAPPGSGSPVARFAAPVLGRICQPVTELSSAPDSLVNRLPDASSYELGVLAARFDILIPPRNSHIDGERGYRLLNATHNSLLISSKAAKLASTFLISGRFAS